MKARRVVATRRTIVFRPIKISGLYYEATLRWMRNVLPLAFTRTRGSFFNVAALTRPRHTDRLTTVGLPPFTFPRFRCCEVLRRAISKIMPFDGVPSNSRILSHIPAPIASEIFRTIFAPKQGVMKRMYIGAMPHSAHLGATRS